MPIADGKIGVAVHFGKPDTIDTAARSGELRRRHLAGEKSIMSLVIDELTPGTGTVAATGDSVEVHYTGWLTNGTKFDSSKDRGQPFTFKLGQGMVIRGWDEGVKGMKVGGIRKLTIPAEMAYGSRGAGGRIPPNAVLVFEVELLKVNGKG
jgi:FKBP-type peptidyl-prolyl cis-trans isomerase FkpA